MKKINLWGKKICVDWNEVLGIVLWGFVVKKFVRFLKYFKFVEDILIVEFYKIFSLNFN